MSCKSYQGRYPCDCPICGQNDIGGIWLGLAGATLLGLIVAVATADAMQPIRNFIRFIWGSV